MALPKILQNSQLIKPWEAIERGEPHNGWTVDEVRMIIASNDAARLVVDAAGGVAAWQIKTRGGKKDPALWDFPIPDWPPKEAEEEKPEGRELGLEAGKTTIPFGEPDYVKEFRGTLADIKSDLDWMKQNW